MVFPSSGSFLGPKTRRARTKINTVSCSPGTHRNSSYLCTNSSLSYRLLRTASTGRNTRRTIRLHGDIDSVWDTAGEEAGSNRRRRRLTLGMGSLERLLELTRRGSIRAGCSAGNSGSGVPDRDMAENAHRSLSMGSVRHKPKRIRPLSLFPALPALLCATMANTNMEQIGRYQSSVNWGAVRWVSCTAHRTRPSAARWPSRLFACRTSRIQRARAPAGAADPRGAVGRHPLASGHRHHLRHRPGRRDGLYLHGVRQRASA